MERVRKKSIGRFIVGPLRQLLEFRQVVPGEVLTDVVGFGGIGLDGFSRD